MAIGRPDRADSVARALQIIEAVADLGLGTTGSEIARHLGFPQASTYRLLNGLVADEYLVRTADLRGFALGARLSTMLSGVLPPPVPARARELIDEFRSSVRFAVHLVYFRPTTLRVLDPDPDHPLTGIGELMRYPHASAPGKILLASLSQWREVVGTSPTSLTPATIIDLTRLGDEIAQIRRTDVAIDDGELVCDHAHVAVPILDVDGDVRGAVMIGGVSTRLDAIRSLVDAAKGLSSALGPLLF
ncbi:putative transcriptional regulator, IclR family [Gordonia polyisoprenivorans VH2]|uniref:Putative transcriptional regulator, IclR family n=1 Tax=Gordonia polyisoprenivorans (strain DSM 44266 / VH2) TaxID=1112204 RepID=H6MYH1_GORPV|nr:IclR family transcriptional regulator C-terminal domain-containing protein [Gordonia polyisoprenivorans]AFA75604.1 putative transcriptional regulator, IclR family [Gordonia polyisoprenivorans VH2]